MLCELTKASYVEVGQWNMVEMAIHRKWLFILQNGTTVLDWGQGKAQEAVSGKFVSYVPKDYARAVDDETLTRLIDSGRVIRFDQDQVVIRSWQ